MRSNLHGLFGLEESVALLPEFDGLLQILGAQFGFELKVPDGW